YNARTLYIIDVSQSVEHDHPHALEFLRNDCTNITEYFKKKGVRIMSVRELFDFITDVNIGMEDEKVEAELDKIQERLASQQSMETLNEEQLQKEKVDEEVFKQSYIPRTLGEVIDAERDTIKVAQGEGLSIDDKSESEDHGDHEDHGDDEDHEDEEDQEFQSEKYILKEQDEKELEDNQIEQDSNDENVNDLFEKQSRGKRNEDKDVKKERKKLAKEEAREKRKHKMPKAEKKKKIKATSGRKSK
ncbi:28470_t:CDS:2, partial [Dentiscutata erythropus]